MSFVNLRTLKLFAIRILESIFLSKFKGALAIECREGDKYTQGLLHKLIDEQTTFQVIAERSFMQYLEGGCSIPLGVRSEFTTESDLPPKSDTNKKAIDEDKKTDEKVTGQKGDLKDNAKINASKETSTKSSETNGTQTDQPDSKRTRAHLDAISNLKLSGVVISLDGQKCVQFDCKLKDVDLNSIEDRKIDCTKIVLPTRECPKQSEVREQYIACAKLGIHLAKQLQALGAKSILDEINKSRKPVSD